MPFRTQSGAQPAKKRWFHGPLVGAARAFNHATSAEKSAASADGIALVTRKPMAAHRARVSLFVTH